MNENWINKTYGYHKETVAHSDPVNFITNGYIGCRGFQEELHSELNDLGGIYLAGVFGWAKYTPWSGDGHELVNTPNFLYTILRIDGNELIVNEATMHDFISELDMKNNQYIHSYIIGDKEDRIQIQFKRFVARHAIHIAGQSIEITCLDKKHRIEVFMGIKADVTNLNDVSCEPWPIQPGKKQFNILAQDKNSCHVRIQKEKGMDLIEVQKIEEHDFKRTQEEGNGVWLEAVAEVNKTLHCKKLISVVSSKDQQAILTLASQKSHELKSYQEEYEMNQRAMDAYWKRADIVIDGPVDDQIALRYNIFQLMQVAPEHDPHLSIGARGISGEMYEGCVFWDTEIFMLPFFSLTNPEVAKKLLMFRYHTLNASRQHARNNYFKGAMYGWQVNELGVEQTPQGVGAYYSIHVIADIAYALLQYWNATKDIDFMMNYGIELLIETSRFWVSRVQKIRGRYEIRAVRGPNEYDVIVHNNCYTNSMAKENMILAADFLIEMKESHLEEYRHVKEKLDFDENELDVWKDIIENLFIPFDEERNLYLEDDAYLDRRELDIKEFKKTKKRIIDTTLPYEALPLYQISKQADVLHLMIHLPFKFTDEQQRIAWDFYEPRTCFDSSLAYSMHSLLAAKLKIMDKAYEYFQLSANLDIHNQQLNTISGLHYANFGGTWQAVVHGFCGIHFNENYLSVEPHLPEQWKSIQLQVIYHQQVYRLILSNDLIKIEPQNHETNETVEFMIHKKSVLVKNEAVEIEVHYEKI